MNLKTQVELEKTYAKNQRLETLLDCFKKVSMKYKRKELQTLLQHTLAHLCLHKICNPPTLVGLLHPRFATPQKIADTLLIIAKDDYINYSTKNNLFTSKLQLRKSY